MNKAVATYCCLHKHCVCLQLGACEVFRVGIPLNRSGVHSDSQKLLNTVTTGTESGCPLDVFCNVVSSVLILCEDNTNQRGQQVSGSIQAGLHGAHNWSPPCKPTPNVSLAGSAVQGRSQLQAFLSWDTISISAQCSHSATNEDQTT